ncbi:PaaI family thioesterase [Halorubrum ezzemoulense]|uniref:PaaI family thioesterase n=1 Tax=Halorubrum ezzemoulense TaxID=337243 RepID=UPI00232ED2C1|nr:PaaI family thioesterase [Halorubrum ezzemoulense]MDB2260231.1 PaaI family thioesterase [Halorubrum ezzemoulense]MDB2267376.1 PaaI family thioesterase [Halorubrum ezzemoulense]
MPDPSDAGPGAGDSDRRPAPSSGEADRTAVVERLYGEVPFHRRHDLEVLAVTPERASVKLPFDPELVGNPDLGAVHGGVVSALVDLAGAAVFVGGREAFTPTIDLRVNYLEAAGREPLYATATVDRRGADIGVASVEVESGDAVCATGTGVYKLTDD